MKSNFSKIDGFKIYVDQLKRGHVEKIEENFAPDFLDVQEKDLTFHEPVEVKGEAYVTEGNLILHLYLKATVELPCLVCNTVVKVPIQLDNFYQAIPLNEIKGAVFSMADLIREAILIEVPTFAECDKGKCKNRKEIEKYLHKPSPSGQDQTRYRPFEGLTHE